MYYKKIAYIVLLASFILSLVIFNGTADYFAPLRTAQINEIRPTGYLTESELIDSPAFFSFGVIIELIVGISSRSLTFFPIQLLPLILLNFTLLYKLSNSYLLSSIFVLIESLTGISGTPTVFFWAHGLGRILFYAILLILLSKMREENKISEYILILIILGISLAFTSYDIYGMLLLFLFVLFLLYSFINLLLHNSTKKINYRHTMISNYCLILIIVELGISEFIYRTLIPLFRTTDYVEISAIEKFFLAYFSSTPTKNPFGDMILNYPSIITELSLVKYMILTLSILICLTFITKKLIRSKDANVYDLFITSYLISSMGMGIIRLFIGDIPITNLYAPGIYCTIWLYRFTKTYRKWTIFVISLLLIMTPLCHYVYNSNNLINKDQNMFEYINMPIDWCIGHGKQNIASSDELTANFGALAISEYFETTSKPNNNYEVVFNNIEIANLDEAAFLVQKSNIISDKKYYIVNYKPGFICLNNWAFLKSWKHYKAKIDSNLKINKIYDIDNIAIYY